jgi:5-methyltetrahydrofolate--homocysteine methyltransferase
MDLHSALTTHKILIADGGTGSQLIKAGLKSGTAPESWNLDNPQAILNHYQSYLDAGSDIILTNTFGGSALKLTTYKLDGQTEEINRQAALLARQAAGPDRLVFGDVGPCGKMLKPVGKTPVEEVEESFVRQITGLAAGGVDAILVETMSDLEEAKAGVRAAKRICSLPIIVTMSFDSHGRTMMGVKPSAAATTLWPLGLAAIGANCGRTLTETYDAVVAMMQAVPDATYMAKPNAGLPHMDQTGESVYDVTPEVMAEYSRKFMDLGVKIFGGCCGSNPDHIRAVSRELKK